MRERSGRERGSIPVFPLTNMVETEEHKYKTLL